MPLHGAQLWRDNEMEPGQVCPYKIHLDNGTVTWAPVDEDDCIRKERVRIDATVVPPAKKQRA